MTYRPGDNWAICDLTGKKVLMSDTRKTWDGLRVWKEVWYSRNPQDFIRAIPDRMQVHDARPRPADVNQYPAYGCGPITLISPNGSVFSLTVKSGIVTTNPTGYQPFAQPIIINGYELQVDDSGTPYAIPSTETGPASWLLAVDGTVYEITTGPYFDSQYFGTDYFTGGAIVL